MYIRYSLIHIPFLIFAYLFTYIYLVILYILTFNRKYVLKKTVLLIIIFYSKFLNRVNILIQI